MTTETGVGIPKFLAFVCIGNDKQWLSSHIDNTSCHNLRMHRNVVDAHYPNATEQMATYNLKNMEFVIKKM